MDFKDHTGIVLAENGKNKWAIDFNFQNKDKLDDFSGISDNELVTKRSYNEADSSFQSTLATLNKNDLTKFVDYCISDEASQLKYQNCWTFLDQTIQFLHRKGKTKISHYTMSPFSEKLNKIISFNYLEHIRKIKAEL